MQKLLWVRLQRHQPIQWAAQMCPAHSLLQQSHQAAWEIRAILVAARTSSNWSLYRLVVILARFLFLSACIQRGPVNHHQDKTMYVDGCHAGECVTLAGCQWSTSHRGCWGLWPKHGCRTHFHPRWSAKHHVEVDWRLKKSIHAACDGRRPSSRGKW